MMEGDQFSDFFLLWSICHQSRVEHEQAAKCWLEVWTNTSRTEGVRALDKLRDGVQKVDRVTRAEAFSGMRPTRSFVRHWRPETLDKQEYYRQLLRLVYRLIFIFRGRGTAHIRAASRTCWIPVPPTKPRLCYLAILLLAPVPGARGQAPGRSAWRPLARREAGRWEQLDDGCPALALPALGSGLWDPEGCSRLTEAECSNEHFLDSIRASSAFTRGLRPTHSGQLEKHGCSRNWAASTRACWSCTLASTGSRTEARLSFWTRPAGHERRTTGSYYTPTPLVDSLLGLRALDPVLD